MKSKLKQAFTMAEVLLVVGIIGVTAALAIPNIKNNGFNEEKYIMLLRTTIPMLQAAEMKARAEYGDRSFNLQHVAKYLNVAKVCSTATDCLANKAIKRYNSSTNEYDDSHLSRFTYGVVLTNGVSIVESNRDYEIYIDLDNVKGPSTYRVDFFDLFCSSCYNDDRYQYFSNENLAYNWISWPILYGNMDYLKCRSDLSWDGKHACD